MSERKSCVRCTRPIDLAARACPFCNWSQTETPPPSPPKPAAEVAAAPAPVADRSMKKKIYGAVAFVSLLVIAFVVGSFIHGFEPSDAKAAQDEIKRKNGTAPPPVATDTRPAPTLPNPNVTLIPDGSMTSTPAEQPITTTPGADGTPSSVADATALPAQQYAIAAERARAQQQTQTIDPRSLTGAAYPEAAAPPRPRRQMAAQRHAVQQQPIPEYQPVPHLDAAGSARLALTIDQNGRVRDIEIVRAAQGDMGRLIGAVQSWRFRPAMENGQPVPARFTVDIKFND